MSSRRYAVLGGYTLCIAALAWALVWAGCAKPPQEVAPLPTDSELQQKLDDVIEFSFRYRRLDTRNRAAWQIIHAAVAFGQDLVINDDKGRVVRAVDYVLNGGNMTGWTLLPGSELGGGRRGIRALEEPGTSTGQGHKDQWLGYLAGAKIEPQRTVKLVRDPTTPYTLADWIEQVKLDVYDGAERGWTLMAFHAYLPLSEKWTAGDGTTWTVERTMATEAATDIYAGSCGGTHSLGGMMLVLNQYLSETGSKIMPADKEGELPWLADRDGKEIATGGFADANRKIQAAIAQARAYQQFDGSFSAEYFQRADHTKDQAGRLRTTGHVVEFLTMALSDDELKEEWVVRSVDHVCDILQATKSQDLECGALYHAMHGLVLYRERRFGPLPFSKWADEMLAQQPAPAADGPKPH